MAASQRLIRALHQQLGDEPSRELLTWMGQMDSNRTELSEFYSEFLKFAVQTNRRFDVIDRKFEAIDRKFEALDSKFDGKFEVVTSRIEMLIEKRHAELLKWAFVFWCGSVFAMVALVIAAK